MAYTIISQNNSTTTLTDGVNTITVPSRVNLTSGNFTIVEVNNNMATLEDGDGNVYRDIPCVATLAGEGGGGGSGLPDQTGHSGEFLTTDGTDASWSDKPLVNTATQSTSVGIKATSSYARAVYIGDGVSAVSSGGDSVLIGYNVKITTANTSGNTIIGGDSKITGQGGSTLCGYYNNASGKSATIVSSASTATGNYSCVFGGVSNSATAKYAIQLGGSSKTNSDANTFKVGNENGNFEMMSADGTIPTARLTKVNTTITLAAADWSSNTQTVSVTGVTATGIVFVSPDPTDQSAYTSAGIICSAQAAGTLTFTCSTTPSADLSVNVVML